MAGRPVREIIRDLHIGTTASTGRATIRHRSGRSVDVDYTITPTAPAAGRHAETVLTLRDVATERRLAGEVEQTIRLALIGRSAAAAVHELNTLIAIAAQHAEVLLAYTGGDASSAKSIALVGDALRRGRRVSEEILRFTRAPEPQLRRIDLSDWIPRVADEARALLDGQKMRVEPPATLHVQADPDQLSQVLFNLVANAVDATPASGAVTIGAARAETIPFVKERVEDASRFVVIYACDTGSGIAAETRERMFEPLFTTRTDGTGFGLATSQRVVTRHGGRILVDSAPGEGAAFYVVLPAGQEARP
jgi:signal transduction histidine kinase